MEFVVNRPWNVDGRVAERVSVDLFSMNRLKLRGGPGLLSQTVAGRRVYACPATPSGVVVLGKVIVNHQVPWKHLLIPGLRRQWSQRLAQLQVAASGSDVCPKHLVSWTPHRSLQNIVIQCLLSEHLKACHQPSPA